VKKLSSAVAFPSIKYCGLDKGQKQAPVESGFSHCQDSCSAGTLPIHTFQSQNSAGVVMPGNPFQC